MVGIHFDESCNRLVNFRSGLCRMPSAAVAGHYEIFNALQNKTEQNSENTFLKKYKLL